VDFIIRKKSSGPKRKMGGRGILESAPIRIERNRTTYDGAIPLKLPNRTLMKAPFLKDIAHRNVTKTVRERVDQPYWKLSSANSN